MASETRLPRSLAAFFAGAAQLHGALPEGRLGLLALAAQRFEVGGFSNLAQALVQVVAKDCQGARLHAQLVCQVEGGTHPILHLRQTQRVEVQSGQVASQVGYRLGYGDALGGGRQPGL